jgi:WD40 repeat protein
MARKKQNPISRLLGKKEPKEEFSETKEPEVEEFIEIGGSPVPGITLKSIFRGHTDSINRIAWSPDGRFLASPSEDTTVRIWDVETEECISVLKGHNSTTISVKWSPDMQSLISNSSDGTVRIWNLEDLSQEIIGSKEDFSEVFSGVWTPDGKYIVFGPREKSIRVWDVNKHRINQMFNDEYVWTFQLVHLGINRSFVV